VTVAHLLALALFLILTAAFVVDVFDEDDDE
jgi:hypothetical protein